MMNTKVHLTFLQMTLIFLGLAMSACSGTSPEDYFDRAVLNTNTFARFGGQELRLHLAPGYKFNHDTKKTEQVTRADYAKTFQNTIEIVKGQQKKVLELPVTKETQEMITTSKELYEFVLEKYQNEYIKIFTMKDQGKSNSEIEAAIDEFDKTHGENFSKLHSKLIELGLAYAKKHDIKVKTR